MLCLDHPERLEAMLERYRELYGDDRFVEFARVFLREAEAEIRKAHAGLNQYQPLTIFTYPH